MDVRELRSALLRKLETTEDRKGHHIYHRFEFGGRRYRVAMLSHSARGQLPDFVVSNTARRLKLSRAELEDLVNCPLSGDEFRRLWETR